MTINTSELAQAITVIAKFFDEPMTDQDGVITNALAFPQKKILNGLCYSATNGASYTATVTMQKATDELKAALTEHKGDELSDVKVARKLAWLERIEDQLAHLEAFKSVAVAEYELYTGESYVHERPKTQAVSGVKLTDAVARAQARFGKSIAPDTSYNSGQAADEKVHGLRTPAKVEKKRA